MSPGDAALDRPDNTAAPFPGQRRGLETVSAVVSEQQPTADLSTQAGDQHAAAKDAVAAAVAADAAADTDADARPGKIALTKVTIPQDAPASAAAPGTYVWVCALCLCV